MASFLCKISTIVAIVCLALLLSDDQHVAKGDEDLCGAPSALFHGSCFDDGTCNDLCKGAEGAIKGSCQDQMCFCINKFQKQKLSGTPASKLHGFCLNGGGAWPKVCDKPSALFHGACWDNTACHNLCVGAEDAAGGLCWTFQCKCLYNC